MKDNLKCTLSDGELVIRCEKWIRDLCSTGGNAWSLQVPANMENDPDILFDELIRRFRELGEKKICKFSILGACDNMNSKKTTCCGVENNCDLFEI